MIVTTIDLLEYLKKIATSYVKQGTDSVIRNAHMNQLSKDDPITNEQVEAVVVDFINYVGMKNCVDYALYTSDLKKEDSQ